MKRFKQLTTASILTGSLVGLALNGIPGAASSVHAQAPRYTTCAVNEYRDVWRENISLGRGVQTVTYQLHYRINADCSFKAYEEYLTGLSSPPSYNTTGSSLVYGYPGSPTAFDGFYVNCTPNTYTGYYSQVSATPALIADYDFWYKTTNCSDTSGETQYTINNQP